MSTFEPGRNGCPSRRPVARRVAEAHERHLIGVAGRIVSACCVRHGSGPAYRCRLDDGTGTVDLLFVGRREVPGMVVGTRCTIEGTVQRDAHGLVTWNPWYRLEGCDAEWGRGDNWSDRPWSRGDDGRRDSSRS